MANQYSIEKRLKERIHKTYRAINKNSSKNYSNKQLKVYLQGGLCNKLHCFFSACDIALKNNATLIEPYFGWKNKINFSDIYDLSHFNKSLSKYNNGKDLIIARNKISKYKLLKIKTLNNSISTWDYSEKELAKERKSGIININSSKLIVLEALKLNPKYNTIIKDYKSKNLSVAVQIRTEHDWIEYAKSMNLTNKKEAILVSLEKLALIIKEKIKSNHIFFTSGENHEKIKQLFKKTGYNSNYFFNPNLEYEINAAINFEICAISDCFIGNSRSTFSNLSINKKTTII